MSKNARTGTSAEIMRFLAVGIGATVVDFCVYIALFSFGLPTAPSKLIAAIGGIGASYAGNRFFTFKNARTSARNIAGFLALYGMTLAANVAVNEFMLSVLALKSAAKIGIAFICATCVSAVLNYSGLKYIVFKAR